MKFYTIIEVAEILNISAVSIRRYIKSGKLEASKMGGLWRISSDDIQSFFEKNKPKKENEDGSSIGQETK